MELERSAVFGSQCSPISDDRWHERDERANIQSHASASFPPHLLCSFLPPHLGCSISFLSHEWMWGGGLPVSCIYTKHRCHDIQTHITPLLPVIPSIRLLFSPFPPFLSIFILRYCTHHGGRKQPTQFWLSEHTKSFGLLGFWILLCYFVVMKPWIWWLAKRAEKFHSVQQGYTSFVKQAASNYPLNTMLTINMNFSEKLICIPAGCNTFKATHKQELSCSLAILLPDTELVQLLFPWFIPYS